MPCAPPSEVIEAPPDGIAITVCLERVWVRFCQAQPNRLVLDRRNRQLVIGRGFGTHVLWVNRGCATVNHVVVEGIFHIGRLIRLLVDPPCWLSFSVKIRCGSASQKMKRSPSWECEAFRTAAPFKTGNWCSFAETVHAAGAKHSRCFSSENPSSPQR